MQYCCNCFHELVQDSGPCPRCGYDPAADQGKYPFALPHGSILAGQFITGRVLGQGGFGITYLALDSKLKSKVAIKEFMPDSMAVRTAGTPQITVYSGQRKENFQYGMERFLDEAKVLARFQENPNIVGVRSYFEENGTAYFVMEYVEGVSFKTYIKEHGGKISWEETVRLLMPVMDALDAVHKEGIIHRDVTPDNIFITNSGGVKLLDFGSARYSLGDKSRSLDVVLKAGYAPKEQYTRRGRQGPYTDVYSLAACLYSSITGYLPPESLDRADEDDLVLPSTYGISIPQAVEDVIIHGLEVQPADRCQSMEAFRTALVEAMAAANEAMPVPAEPEAEPISEPEPVSEHESPAEETPNKTVPQEVVDFDRQKTAEEAPPLEKAGKRISIHSGKIKYGALAACCVLIVCAAAFAGDFWVPNRMPAAEIDPRPGSDSAYQNNKTEEPDIADVNSDAADTSAEEGEAAGEISPVSEDAEIEKDLNQQAADDRTVLPPPAKEEQKPEPAPAPSDKPVQEQDSKQSVSNREFTVSITYLVKTKSNPNIDLSSVKAGGEDFVDRMGLAASQGRRLLLQARQSDMKLKEEYLKEGTPKNQELRGLYTGDWSNGQPDGQGTFTITTDSPYGGVWNGTWKNGVITYGTCQYSNGDHYEGSLGDGSPNGYGIMKYKSGERYEGNWKNGMWHGDGTVTRADGTSEAKSWYHNSDQALITTVEARLKAIEKELGELDRNISENIEGGFKYFE